MVLIVFICACNYVVRYFSSKYHRHCFNQFDFSHHVLDSIYGSWAMGTLLYGEIIDKDLLNATFNNDALCGVFRCGGDEGKASYVVVFHYLFRRHMQIVGVLLLMLFIVGCLGVFLGFHLYISSQNMTTNEYYKWREVKKKHDKLTERYIKALKDGTAHNIASNRKPVFEKTISDDVDVGCMGPAVNLQRNNDEDLIYDPGPMPENVYK